MRESYRHMGVSIFAGFITTFGSGFMLIFCDFKMLQKFGIVICETVAFSFIVATFLFGAFMHAVGPQKYVQNERRIELLEKVG